MQVQQRKTYPYTASRGRDYSAYRCRLDLASSVQQRWADIDFLAPDPYPKKFLNIHIQSLSENFRNLLSDIHPYPNATLVKYETGSGYRSTSGPSFFKTYSSITGTMILIHDKCAADCTALHRNLVSRYHEKCNHCNQNEWCPIMSRIIAKTIHTVRHVYLTALTVLLMWQTQRLF